MIDLKPQTNIDAAWWDGRYSAGEAQGWTIWTDRRMLEHVVRHTPAGARVLMLAAGSGVGPRSLLARRPDLRFTLADYSAEGLLAARDANEAAGLAAYFEGYQHVDLDETPWPWNDRQFDVVICSEVLEHLQNPKQAAREAGRVAGAVLFTTLPAHPELLSSSHRWLFESLDPWRFIPHVSAVHHLREGKLLLAVSKFPK
jgi:2-polyprenyl-3-methyl-5-hydroxy-6-metoxy-1,4-benzoquinol methylase